MNAPDSHDAVEIDLRWTDEASKRLERAPIFLRGMVRRLAEKKARELGYVEITGDLLEQFKNQMMGGMGGESGMAEAVQGRWPCAICSAASAMPDSPPIPPIIWFLN